MTVTIYHNPACGTSRNVLAMIRNAGMEPTIVNYLATPLSRDQIKALVGKTGQPVRELLRRKGTPYDQLGLDDPALSDDELIDFVVRYPILMNRPIVVTDFGARLCRPSEEVAALLPPGSLPESFTKEDGEIINFAAHGKDA
jgi:arsenate reductase